MILSILLCIIFTALGLIHFNWVIGGKFGLEKSLPTNENGEKILNSKKIYIAIIGIGLTLLGLFYLIKSGFLEFNIPDWTIKYIGWIIPIIFLLRAIGDFKYAGFFKRIKDTEFGKWDSKLFSPLCLFIGICGVLTQLIK
jgi:hypothetical protein